MSDIRYRIEERNIMNMITGGNFYQEQDMFLRELLQNAIDACYTRSALNKSWGAELLAFKMDRMQQFAEQEYKPHIRIQYQRETRFFSIEDNGTGMDAREFDAYFRKIGASYYTSEDYSMQKLKYTPVGQFGLGMLSCFEVTDVLHLESKKDKSVNTIWNKEKASELIPIEIQWEKSEPMMQVTRGEEIVQGRLFGSISIRSMRIV